MAMAQVAFKLRLPEALKAKLEEATKESGNSLNSEIIMRLGQSFQMDQMREGLREVSQQLAAAHEWNAKLADYVIALTAPKVRVPEVKPGEAA
jgi:hypothetical protein